MTLRLASFSWNQDGMMAASRSMSRQAIMRGLAFVRTRARSSLRRRKRASSPGMPPSVHSRDKFATLKNILFSWDAAAESGIVGPVFTNQKNLAFNGILGRGTVPKLHEYGGTAAIREKRVAGKWVSVGRRRPRPGESTRMRRAVYPPRPFVGPAAKAEITMGTFSRAWPGPKGRANTGPVRRAA